MQQDDRVTLTFAEPNDSKYVSLKERASVNQDRAKIEELWNPLYRAWFSKGQDDPEITVLRIDVSEADFWKASRSKLAMGLKYLAAAMTSGTLP